tara:strand:+ start:3285 stop:3452 length:168 start_codon:yes stop_codon:yes gene_type:complete
MEYFLNFLDSDKYVIYVLTAYFFSGFVILALKLFSSIKLRKLEKKYTNLVGKHES